MLPSVLSVLVTCPVLLVATATPARAVPNRAYVANRDRDVVAILDTTTNTLVSAVVVGDQPSAVALTPDRSRLYVTNIGSDTVSVINTATEKVVATIPVGQYPADVAITPDGSHAYVSNLRSNSVSVIRINTGAPHVVATIAVGTSPGGIAITPDGTRGFVTNQDSDTVSVIKTRRSGSLLDALGTLGDAVVATVAVGRAPVAVAITPDGSRAYVTNKGPNTVSVISSATNTVVTTVPVGETPVDVAISPDGTRGYVANVDAGTVSVVSIKTTPHKVVATIAVGAGPNGVAFSPDGARAYVTNYSSGTVSVIDSTLNTVVASVAVAVGVADVAVTAPSSDLTRPSVTINQASSRSAEGQQDPTSSSPIVFEVVFSEPVKDFGAADVVLGGSAKPWLATVRRSDPGVSVTGAGTRYTVSVTGMSRLGTVTARIASGAVTDLAGNPNSASTSTDNTVSYVPPRS